MISESYYTK